MAIGPYRDQGIVLRGIKLGEADRIVTVYTQNNGRVRAVAKGIRKAKSRFGGRLDAFTHVDLQLYRGRGDLDTITQAEIIARYPRLREDYDAFCAAGAMADAVERTTPERDRNVRLFLTLRSGLEALASGPSDPGVLAYAFLAKVASQAGLHPTLSVCVGCGALERVAFSNASGGVVCTRCLEPTDPDVSADVLDAWTSFMRDGFDALAAVTLDPLVRRRVGELILSFVQWHADSRLRAFSLIAVR